MSCYRLAFTNGEKSILFDRLYQLTQNEAAADELYHYFETEDFIKRFGEFRADLGANLEDKKLRDRLDSNGEPLLFLNKNLNKYYYKDENGEHIYYPEKQGLRQFLPTNDIKTVAKMIALKFYESNIKFDYNSLTFDNKAEVNLKQFTKNFLENKGSELSRDQDFLKQMLGESLLNSVNYTAEWAQEIKDFFSTLKIDVNNQETVVEQEETIRGEAFRKESFLKSSKNNVNNNIKLFLSLLKSNELNEFNEFDFIPFDDIYATLNKKLANKIAIHDSNGTLEDMYDIFLEEILKVAAVKPYLKDLYDQLASNNTSEAFKNQFVAAFNLYNKEYLGSEISIIDGQIYYDVRNLSEVSTRKNTIISLWNYNFKNDNINEGQLKFIRQELNKLRNKYNPNRITEEGLAENITELKNLIEKLGVRLSKKGFSYYMTEQFGSELPQMVKALSKTIDNTVRAIEAQIEDVAEGNIFLKQSIFKEMAEAEAFFMQEGSDASIFTLGKTKWVYSLPSHLERKVNSWKKDPNILLKHYNSSPFNQGSEWMEYLLAFDVSPDLRYEKSKERISEIEIGVFNSIQQQGDSTNAADNKNMSYTDSLVDYVNKLLAFKKQGKVWHKTALAADKNTEYQINWGKGNIFGVSTNIDIVDGNIIINNSVVETFFKYFKAEYDRMNAVAEVIQNNGRLVKHYHTGNKNGLRSQLFPSFSPTFTREGEVLPPETKFPVLLYDEKGFPTYKNLDAVKDDILPFIRKAIQNGIVHTKNILEENNIIYFDEVGVRQNQGIDNRVYEQYLKEAGNDRLLAIHKIAGDLFVNSVMSQVEYSKMITGDIAYYKDTADYKKRVPATYTDGIYMRLLQGEEEFNVAIISSVEVPVPNLDKLKEMLPVDIYEKYTEVNATDAQAWITPQRWEFIMRRLGKWNETTESAYKKFFEPNPIFTSKELKVLAQPLKGVYFDVKDGIPSYLKYSQAVLLPNLIKGTPLERLYKQMVLDEKGNEKPYQDQVHELITEDGIKVGLPVPTTVHTPSGQVSDELNLESFPLNNAGWKLQQDLPTKGVKPTDVGSQIIKNIFQGLAFNQDKTFYLNDNEEISGAELIDHINNLFGALSNKGVKQLLGRLGITDLESLTIENEDALYDNLIKQLSKRSDVPKNFLDALKAHTSPYGIPGAFQMFQNVFSAIVNQEVIKIKTNGAGFIQMADFGLSKNEAIKQGMIFTPWFAENEEHLSPPVIGYNSQGKEIIQPGGIFLSGSMIAKYIPDYKRLSSEELFGKLNEKTGKYEGGRIDEKILKNIIGYRIPNQGLSSNDALQVMGILPEEIGDTVIAYTGITEKTGSDYDIDKMYLMIPSFEPIFTKDVVQKVYDFLSDEKIEVDEARTELNYLGFNTEGLNAKTIFSLLADQILYNPEYDFGDEFFETQEYSSARRLKYSEPTGKEPGIYSINKKALQNKLIEAYKAVLTNPATIADVMNPIEVPHIKNDIKNLVGELEQEDMLALSAIDDLQLKSEFQLGKAGLGQNINSLVDAVRGGMADLFFIKPQDALEWGLYNQNGQTIFDKEWSETLSNKEIEEYVNSYNEGLPEKSKITVDQLKKIAKIKLNESMMGLVNGFVDIAKDSYIVQGNWVTQTNNIGFMLLRAGVHPFRVNAFLAQPILKEYVQFVSNQESKTIDQTTNINTRFKLKKAGEIAKTYPDVTINGQFYTQEELFKAMINIKTIAPLLYAEEEEYADAKKNFFDAVRRQFVEKFNLKGVEYTPEMIQQLKDQLGIMVDIYDSIFESNKKDFDQITLGDLRYQIKIDSDISTQLSILDKFLEWQDYAKVLTQNVNASKVDVNGKGKNITSLLVNINNVNQSRNSSILGGFDSKLYTSTGAKTVLEHSIRNSLNRIIKIMRANPKFFLTAGPQASNTFNMISQHIYSKPLLSQVLGDKLEKAHYSYIMSGFGPLVMNKEEREALLKELPAKLAELKNNPNNDNVLINELAVREAGMEDTFYIAMPNIKKSVGFKNTLTDAWRDLLDTDPQFAEDLIRYAFLTSGFNNTISQFHEYIPYEWFNKNQFNSYLKQLQFNSGMLDSVFMNQFFRHNYKDNTIAKRVFANQMRTMKFDGKEVSRFNAFSFTFPMKDGMAPYFTYLITTDPHTGQEFLDYYEYAGLDKMGRAVYTKTTPLGVQDRTGFKVMEYNINYKNPLTGSTSSFNALDEGGLYNPELIEKMRKYYNGNIVTEKDFSTEVVKLDEAETKVTETQPKAKEISHEVMEKTENQNVFKSEDVLISTRKTENLDDVKELARRKDEENVRDQLINDNYYMVTEVKDEEVTKADKVTAENIDKIDETNLVYKDKSGLFVEISYPTSNYAVETELGGSIEYDTFLDIYDDYFDTKNEAEKNYIAKFLGDNGVIVDENDIDKYYKDPNQLGLWDFC